MTNEQIERINAKAPEDQGIFVEPCGVLYNVKKPVIYAKFEEDLIFENSEGFLFHFFKILDVVLEEICPKITLLHYKKIFDLVCYKEETEEYGNRYVNYFVYYIVISDLENLLKFLGYNI
jgi:hypothetical protein